MRDDPGIERRTIAACLAAHYGLQTDSIIFLPLGHDADASVYRVDTRDGRSCILKIRSGPVNESALVVPRALIDLGIPNILAPLRTRTMALWALLEEDGNDSVVLYPFIRGDDAKAVGLSIPQWRRFGATLRAVHDSGLTSRFRDQPPTETFTLPSAALVRRVMGVLDAPRLPVERATAEQFAAFLRANRDRIDAMLARAEALGRSLQAKRFELVLCHTDIHAANILVGADGRIWLIDWDGPKIAPRERDLLFVIGSRIARRVEPHEEDAFFDGYGPVEIDPDALVYFRYERIIEDLGEFAERVLLDPGVSDAARRWEADLAIGLFAPDGDIDRADTVSSRVWPRSPH